MISDADLSQMQRAAQAAMPDTATILRNTPTSAAGGAHATWAAIATVPCRLTPMAAESETLVGGEIASQTRWNLALPAGTDAVARDRVQIGSRLFEVVGGGEQSWEITHSLILVEILH